MEYEAMSPSEKETDIRAAFQASQEKINHLVASLVDEYQYFTFLRQQIQDIDIYGAEDLFGKPQSRKICASLERNGYHF